MIVKFWKVCKSLAKHFRTTHLHLNFVMPNAMIFFFSLFLIKNARTGKTNQMWFDKNILRKLILSLVKIVQGEHAPWIKNGDIWAKLTRLWLYRHSCEFKFINNIRICEKVILKKMGLRPITTINSSGVQKFSKLGKTNLEIVQYFSNVWFINTVS